MSFFKLHKDFETLPERIFSSDKARVTRCKEEILSALEQVEASELIAELKNSPTLEFLANAISLSSYFNSLTLVHPKQLLEFLIHGFDKTISSTISSAETCWKEVDGEASLMSVLRGKKRMIALSLGLADLGGWKSAEQITRHLAEFADATLCSATNFLLSDLHRQKKLMLQDLTNPSKNSGLIILGMGKHGAHELNYSSDIDIILFFDTQAKMEILDDDPTSLFVRFAKRLIKIMQERTGDGYVFRTDLRLRPDPGSTPLALPVATAFNYYEAYGQNWERAAFIKARAVAGDMEAGIDFLKELIPFIWRKYLDFAAISDVHSIKRQIHVHKGHGEIAVNGHNVKLGRGGIREIEFFAQTQQLIAGGRNPNLRKIGTIAALNALAEDGWIKSEAAEILTDCYWYLRDVEHRIQMIADEQTHILPQSEEGLLDIAQMMGNETTKEFAEKLTEVMKLVEHHYAALFETSPELTGKGGNLVFTGDEDDPGTLQNLSDLGYKQPSQIIATIRGWHFGRLHAIRTSQAREILTELTPALIEAFAETDQPDSNFFAFERFLSGLPAGLQLFSILKSNPNLLRLLSSILGSAPRLAEVITIRPNVFDGLISPSFGPNAPEKSELAETLNSVLSQLKEYEAKLDQIRIFNEEQKFLIGVRLLNRTISARQAGIAYSNLADVVLTHILQMVRAEFESKHGVIENGEIAVLGMGRLGSNELTAGSDLDLIFLYRQGETDDPSNGAKPLYPAQYYMRLVQRLITATSAPTAQGVAYELDFRLRPSGNSGPLATELNSFITYQEKDAWIWEHQALVRARPICGDVNIINDIRSELAKILGTSRDRKKISREILKMRKLLDKERPAKHNFDIKNAKGGLIDIEFIAQWGVLVYEGQEIKVQGTAEIIEALPDELINVAQKQELKAAFGLFNIILQLLRVNLIDGTDPKDYSTELSAKLAQHAGEPDLPALVATLKDVHVGVRNIFSSLLTN